MAFGKSRARMYAEKETEVSFDDVAGQDEAKEERLEMIECLKNPKKFRILGGNYRGSVRMASLPASIIVGGVARAAGIGVCAAAVSCSPPSTMG